MILTLETINCLPTAAVFLSRTEGGKILSSLRSWVFQKRLQNADFYKAINENDSQRSSRRHAAAFTDDPLSGMSEVD